MPNWSGSEVWIPQTSAITVVGNVPVYITATGTGTITGTTVISNPYAWATTSSTTTTTTNCITWCDSGTGGIQLWCNPLPQGMLAAQQQAMAQEVMQRQHFQQQAAMYQQNQLRWQEQAQRAQLAQASAERQQARQLHAHPKTAHDRAFELLLAHLTEEQQAMYKEHGFFVVEGGRSKQRYRIRASGLVGNIDVLDGERVRHRLCAHADPTRFPLGDHLLAQKLMLECDEDRFLRIANRHG